jgi:hypothetical protein
LKVVVQASRQDELLAYASHEPTPEAAVAEIAQIAAKARLGSGLVFCSSNFDRQELAQQFNRHFPDLALVGCTSAGELTQQGYDEDSLLFIGFPEEEFTLTSLRFTDLDHLDVVQAQAHIRRLVADARRRDPAAMHVAMIFVDGLSHREELLAMIAQEALGDVELIGGSSGDALAFRDTAVLHEGEFHRQAAVIALLSSQRPLHAFCSTHYRAGAQKMVVTQADAASRTVYEINAEPAAQAYRRLIGIESGPLDALTFAAHPPMVRIGGRYHVRSIQSVNPDDSLTFYCAIDAGIVLTIGEPVNRLAELDELFAACEKAVGPVDKIIGFDCVLNRIDAAQHQISRQISALYVDHHVYGFNTYGEQFRSAHMNQTFSGLAIGQRRA